MEIDVVMRDANGEKPGVDIAHEEALLTRKLRLLEDFVRTGTTPYCMCK